MLKSLVLTLALKGFFPFAITSGGEKSGDGGGPKLGFNTGRIIEVLIVAITTAMFTAYVSVQLLKQEVTFVKETQSAYAAANTIQHNDLKNSVERVQNLVEQHMFNLRNGYIKERIHANQTDSLRPVSAGDSSPRHYSGSDIPQGYSAKRKTDG